MGTWQDFTCKKCGGGFNDNYYGHVCPGENPALETIKMISEISKINNADKFYGYPAKPIIFKEDNENT